MKKILSFLLALALLIGIIPMSFAGAATLTDAVKSNYSIETTLSDGIIQKTAKRTFFVIAKDGDGNKVIMEQYKDFGDVSDSYWAAEYIKAAAKSGWINGYEDGSFRADRNISRAEVVTIVNRLLAREADESYIADNLRKLNTFSDMSGKHWAYYAVMEAANAHTAILGDSESWGK